MWKLDVGAFSSSDDTERGKIAVIVCIAQNRMSK